MAATAGQLKNWLRDYPANWTVFIDEDGLTIRLTSPSGSITRKFELGGAPPDLQDEGDEDIEEEEEEEEEDADVEKDT